MAISGAPTGGRWRRFGVTGTNIITFNDFIQYVLASTGASTPGDQKYIIMDNLNKHHNALVLGEIRAAGHRYCFQAPYWPVNGPIEYIFNTIENALSYKMYEVKTVAELQTNVDIIIRNIPSFENCFTNVDYIHN